MQTNKLIEYKKEICSILRGKQKDCYEQMIKDSIPIKVVPLKEVLSEEEIKFVRDAVKPKAKECFKNAHILSLMLADCEYCEGEVEFHGLVIEHAFNKIKDKYVDITFEIVLDRDVAEMEYISYGEYKSETINEVALNNGYYGSIWRTLYKNKLKNG